MPPGTDETIELYYSVTKEFETLVGTAAAWFKQPSGGTQIMAPKSTTQLIEEEYLDGSLESPIESPIDIQIEIVP